MSFSYPALPDHVDAIRILTLKPGEFQTPLIGTLAPAIFGDRPKYVALSYTWGSSYPDNSKLPITSRTAQSSSQPPGALSNRVRSRVSGISGTSGPPKLDRSASTDKIATVNLPTPKSPKAQDAIKAHDTLTLNGHPFRIGHNLHLALLHLRSSKHPITIWVDAICINQADMKERNYQVSLMAFIYTRATKVVAWLGTKNYPPTTGLFHAMQLEWKAGQTQHFGASLMGDGKIRCSLRPDQGTVARILDSKYWTRLWVTQEICLPRFLVLMYGSDIWSYESFSNWTPVRGLNHESRLAALRLLETRDQRHTDVMRFENLIERFAKSECSELRDRIYGLLGCANDIRSFTERDDEANFLKAHTDLLSSGQRSSIHPKRGLGSLKVDYSRPFYDIWTNIVGFVYFQAKQLEQTASVREANTMQALNGHNYKTFPTFEERHISIVRTAGIAQEALDQIIEKDVRKDEMNIDEQEWPVITAVGYIAGVINQLGPDHVSLVGSAAATQDWTSKWDDQYHNTGDLEILRRTNEEYMARVLNYEKEDLARICKICDAPILAWRKSEDRWDLDFLDSGHTTEYEKFLAEDDTEQQAPRIFLGTDFVMGLIPPAAKLGDVIVRFWNCNAAIVMRPFKTDSGTTSFFLVGRADVASIINRNGDATSAVQTILSRHTHDRPEYSDKRLQCSGTVHVDLNLKTLQKITAHVIAQHDSM